MLHLQAERREIDLGQYRGVFAHETHVTRGVDGLLATSDAADDVD